MGTIGFVLAMLLARAGRALLFGARVPRRVRHSFALIPAQAKEWRPVLILASTALVSWFAWRSAASPSRRALTAAAVAAPILAVLGWGYWQVASHGSVYVRLLDLGLRNDRQR